MNLEVLKNEAYLLKKMLFCQFLLFLGFIKIDAGIQKLYLFPCHDLAKTKEVAFSMR